MAFDLKRVLRALLFSSGQPLGVKDIQEVFSRFHESAEMPHPPQADGQTAGEADPPGEEPVPADPDLYEDVPSLVTATQIREAMEAIAAELHGGDSGLLLIEGASGYRLVTDPRFARWVRILRKQPPPVRLSQSALETLAVIAYRQPVTRVEIETIRGVSAEAGLGKLLERELIAVVGRADLPGRPLQYSTTERFLEMVGIKSLDELPASDVLTSRQIDEWLETAANPHKLGDAEMGLSDETLPLESTGPSPGPAEPAPPSTETGQEKLHGT